MVRPAADSAARERLGVGAALRRRVAAADDRERGRARAARAGHAVEHRRRIADLEQAAPDSRDRPRRRGRGPVAASQASVAASRAASGGASSSAAARGGDARCGAAPASPRARPPGCRRRAAARPADAGATPRDLEPRPGLARGHRRSCETPRARRGAAVRTAGSGLADVVADFDRVGRVEHERVGHAVEDAEHEQQADALVGDVERSDPADRRASARASVR